MTKSLEADRAVRGLMAACTAQRGAGFDATDTLALLNYVRDLERDLGASQAYATRLAGKSLDLPTDATAEALTKAKARIEDTARDNAELKRQLIEAQFGVRNLQDAERKFTAPLSHAKRLLVFPFVPEKDVKPDLAALVEDIRAFLNPPVPPAQQPKVPPGSGSLWPTYADGARSPYASPDKPKDPT